MSDGAPQSQSVLENAWSRFAVYDHNASEVQRKFFRLRLAMLVVGIAATVLAIFYPQYVEGANGRPVFDDWRFYVWLPMVALPVLGGVLAAGASKSARALDWISLRGAAESVKRDIFRYRCRVGVYAPDSETPGSRDEKLAFAVGQATARLMDAEIINASMKRRQEQELPPKDSVAEQDDGFSDMNPAQYLDWRLADQLRYFRAKSETLDRRNRRFQWSIAMLGGAGTLLAAAGQEIWVPASVALATALISYLELRNVETNLAGYSRAALELENVETWWAGLPADKQDDHATFVLLVDRTETILGSENATWVQDMQKAVARGEEEAEKSAAGRTVSTA